MATDSIHQFSYHPELIKTGTVYYYIKSNRDGSYPARIFIYIADDEHLEVLKLEEHGMDAALVKAHIDWNTFSADQLNSWILTPDGNHREQASLSSSYEEETFTISWQGRADVVKIGHYPVHIFNFDFISLNHTLPHWDHPEGEVRIGVLQPNFDPNPETLMKYEGMVAIKYIEQEKHNGQPCLKYSLGGEGLRGHTGVMWLNEETRTIEDIEIPIPDNPDWNDFKFKLTLTEYMTPQQWIEFMDSEIKKLKSN